LRRSRREGEKSIGREKEQVDRRSHSLGFLTGFKTTPQKSNGDARATDGTMSSTFQRRSSVSVDDALLKGSVVPAPQQGATSIAAAASSFYRGAKAYTGGSVVVSTGLREWDALLSSSSQSGGQPLGSCILLLQPNDHLSRLGRTLLQYWCAEVCAYVSYTRAAQQNVLYLVCFTNTHTQSR
jgi:hypothetical protein